MCGIVGILGLKPVAIDIVDALRRLEYRGYDSAGIATVENGHLERRRAEGKLRNLETRLGTEPLSGTTGIGHTRWATHGRPIERNAHPHMNDMAAVVHTGIIERAFCDAIWAAGFAVCEVEVSNLGRKRGTRIHGAGSGNLPVTCNYIF